MLYPNARLRLAQLTMFANVASAPMATLFRVVCYILELLRALADVSLTQLRQSPYRNHPNGVSEEYP